MNGHEESLLSSLLLSLPESELPLWVLTETRLRAETLKRRFAAHLDALAQEGAEPISRGKIAFLARNDWLARLAIRELGSRESDSLEAASPGLLRPPQARKILLSLLDRERQEFPLILEELASLSARPEAVSGAIARLLSFFETLSLAKLGNSKLLSLMDDWGNVPEENERTEEEFHLFLRFEEELRTQKLLFGGTRHSFLHERLATGLERPLPGTVVIDEPWLLLPSEADTLEALAKRFPLHLLASRAPDTGVFAAETEALPALRRGALSGREGIFRAITPVPPRGAAPLWPAAALLEKGLPLSDEEAREGGAMLPLDVYAAPCISDELSFVLGTIRNALRDSRHRPDDFQIFAPDLEVYREELRRIAADLGVPVTIGKPAPLRSSTPGRMFLAFLNWLESPGLRTLESLYSYPAWGRLPETPEAREAFVRAITSEHAPELRPLFEGRDLGRIFGVRPGRSLAVLTAFLQRHGILDEVSQTGGGESFALLFLRSVTEAPELEEALLGVLLQARDRSIVSTLADHGTLADCLAAVSRVFHGNRKRLRSLRAAAEPPATFELSRFAFALRHLARLRSRAAEAADSAALVDGWAEVERETPLLACSARVLRQMLAEAAVPERDDGTPKVIVSEFLEARGFAARFALLVGGVAGSFPLKERESESFLHETDFRRESLAAGLGGPSREKEGVLLFSELLRRSEEILITFPSRIDGSECTPAELVRHVARVPFSRRALTVLAVPAEPKAAFDAGERWTERSRKTIAGRRGNSWTAYDGDLRSAEGEGADAVLEAFGPQFSLSELELAADCRHREMFRRGLGLTEEPPGFFKALEHESGNIVHESLAAFFTEMRDSPDILERDFPGACRRLLAHAEAAFVRSGRRWQGNVYEDHARWKIVAGLDEATAEVRAGFLLGALRFQRELMKSWPLYLEKAMSVAIPAPDGSGEAMTIRVKIDRIDREPSPGGSGEHLSSSRYSVWDYKTGKVPSYKDQQSGISLQLPVYAEAVRQNLPGNELPVRGGYISLKLPNRSDDERLSITDGVILERLAVGWKKGYVYDESAAPGNVDAAMNQVRELGKQLMSGDFRQRERTKGCGWCEAREICFRDELAVKRKERNAAARAAVSSGRPREAASRFLEVEGKRSDSLPSREQETASDISRSLALRAGAGSGKTFVLRTRFLRLLLSGEPIDSIVAITFTERAAGEIRRRIELAIEGALESGTFGGNPLSADEVERLRVAHEARDKAQVGTIHSFASRLVRLAPDLSGLYPFEQVISGNERDSLIDSAIEEAERDGSPAGPALRELLFAGISQQSLHEQLKRFLREPRDFSLVLDTLQQEGKRGNIVPFLRAEWAKRVEQQGAFLRDFLGPWCVDAQAWLDRTKPGEVFDEDGLKKFEAVCGMSRRLMKAIEKGEGASWAEAFFALHTFMENNTAIHGRKSKTYPRNFGIEIRDELRRREKHVSILARSPDADRLGLDLVVHLAGAVLEAQSIFRRMKEERGAVDFNDLITGSRTLLETRRENASEKRRSRILRRLRKNLRHLMVDEFQDTDPDQWALLRALFLVPEEAGEKRSIFLVGDNQQAIYGFRGSDVRIFDEAAGEILRRHGLRGSLQDNYRSAPGVIDFVNRFFDLLFGVDFGPDNLPLVRGAVRLQPLIAKREPVGAKNVFVIEKEKTLTGDEGEAERIADFVDLVLKSVEAKDGAWAALERIEAGPKIAVLARKQKQLALVRSALEERGIPFQLGKSSGFFELEEIRTIKLLLKVLLKPEDRTALIGLLRSPFGGCDDAFLFSLRNLLRPHTALLPGSGSIVETLESAVPELEEVCQLLRECSEKLRWEKASAVLAAAVQRSPLLSAYPAEGRTGAAENIRRFVDVLREAERRLPGGGSPAEVHRWLGSLGDESSPATGGAGNEPVTLMTVHAAKGLEFGMVVLPFLKNNGSNAPADFEIGEFDIAGNARFSGRLLGMRLEDEESDFNRKRTLVQYLIDEAAEAKRANEERRLFYVAATRAADYLIFSGQDLSFDGSEKGGSPDAGGDPSEEGRNRTFLSQNPADWISFLGSEMLDIFLPLFPLPPA